MNSDLIVNSLSYLGHATTMIHVDGLHILTDPVLGDRVLHLRRLGVSASGWAADQPDADVILLSHLHLDHLHLPSLRRLPKDIPLILPKGTARWLNRILPQHLIEMEAGDSQVFEGVKITATPAVHGNDPPKTIFDLAQGYLIEGRQKIYFPGDTDVFPEMAELGDRQLDIVLMPIWGWGPTLGKGHLDPERATEALALLRPQVAIPIHWASFRPMGPFWEILGFLHQPGPEFVRLASEFVPETVVHLLQPGESYEFDTSSSRTEGKKSDDLAPAS
jgi:L-ascorbate metabolism protein UlaG (beta-lactamase superfamily)